MRQSVTGIILAGGRSRRMGRDKASLPWQGSDILNTQLDVLAAVCDELVVVSNVPRDIRRTEVQVVEDNFVGCGPLAGIEAGLSAASNEICFVAACDMPFIDADSIVYIIEQSEGWDAAVPLINERWQPLYAVYRKACLPTIRAMLNRGCYRMAELFSGLMTRPLSAAGLKQFSSNLTMLENLNTPAEWEMLQRMP